MGVDVKQRIKKTTQGQNAPKFSPSWVVYNSKRVPGYQLELISRIKTGVKKKDWKTLIAVLGTTEKKFEDILPSSISSMHKKDIYNRSTSERIYQISRLFGLGYEIFNTPEDFKSWLESPSKALGNQKPFDLLDNSFGFELVENEIIRIQYNVNSIYLNKRVYRIITPVAFFGSPVFDLSFDGL